MLIAQKLKQWLYRSQIGNTFLAVILMPIFFIAFYLWVLSPDRYVSSATVMVRESGVDAIEMGLLQALTSGGTGTSEDEQLLQSYIASADLLNALISELEFKAHYSNSWDFVFGINKNSPLEDLILFYRNVVSIERSVESGLLVLEVHAYTPEFSKKLAEKIIQLSEEFINQISHGMAHNEMLFAQAEIERSQTLLKKAKSEILVFQNQYALVSPDSEGQSLISIVYELEADLAKTQAELNNAKIYLNQNAPQAIALKNKSLALKQEISSLKQRITGIAGESADDKLIELGVGYQDLMMDVELATTIYTGALQAYELARSQAIKQQKYLVVASKPQLAEKSLYPERVYWLVSWVVIFSVCFSIFKLLFVTIKEHRD
jgi:capsular polysaccharide transport system permease protein